MLGFCNLSNSERPSSKEREPMSQNSRKVRFGLRIADQNAFVAQETERWRTMVQSTGYKEGEDILRSHVLPIAVGVW